MTDIYPEIRCDWCKGPIEDNELSVKLSLMTLHYFCAIELFDELEDYFASTDNRVKL